MNLYAGPHTDNNAQVVYPYDTYPENKTTISNKT